MDQFEFDQSFFGDAKPIDLESILMSMEIDEVKKIEEANNFYPVYSEELQEKAVGFVGMVDGQGIGMVEASGGTSSFAPIYNGREGGNGRKKKDHIVSIEDTVGKAIIWHGNSFCCVDFLLELF